MKWCRSRFNSIREDDGNITAITTVVVLVLMATLLPLVWNFGTIFAARRGSQNGSDAAALAAAQRVADQLNAVSIDWWGCIPPETPQTIVQRYNALVVMPIGNVPGGYGDAVAYAASNRGSLTQYQQRVAFVAADGVHAKRVAGVTVPPVRINVHGQKSVRGSIFESIYGVDGTPIRAHASSEVYLDRVRSWETPCPANPTTAIALHYQFRWKIRLIEAGG